MGNAYISLGSNLGDRRANISEAIRLTGSFSKLLAVSSLYETPPWGYASSNAYFNACMEVETELSPIELLRALKSIESEMGRIPTEHYSDRSIDLDILFYDNQILNENGLMVPHPEIQNRKFVLMPLNEIAKNFRHPRLNKSINELLILSLDSAKISRID